MNKLILLTILTISSSAYAKDSMMVGYCGAYHLMMGNNREVHEVTRLADDVGTMQMYARQLVARARHDPKGAASMGRYACRDIGFRT
jgi:hypothetical protein